MDSPRPFNSKDLTSSSPCHPNNTSNTSIPAEKNNSELRLLSINFQSVMSKREEFLVTVAIENPDIIVGTETWLTKGRHNDSEFIPTSEYKVYRNDRADGYGGVFIAAKKSLKHTRVTTEFTHVEYLAIKLELYRQKPLVINAAYRPPYNRPGYFNDLCSEIEKTHSKFSNNPFWTLGDFNLPDINWDSLSINGNQYLKDINERALDHINDMYQEQQVTAPTRTKGTSSNILDLFLTNRPALTRKCSLTPGLSDHDVVSVKALVSPRHVKNSKREVLDWKKADWDSLHRQALFFSRVFTGSHKDTNDTDILWKCIKTNITDLIDNHVPKRVLKKGNDQAWITTAAKRLCKKKIRWFKKFKETNSPRVYQKYLDIKKECNHECRKAKMQFLNKLCEEDNSKLFWNHIKSKKLDSSNCTYLKDKNGELHDDDQTKSELFNEQFSSVYSPPVDKQLNFVDPPCLVSSPNILVTENGVLKLMSDLKPHKATGPDNIPPRLLKELATELAPVFTILFNASLKQGVVPSDWRSAHVAWHPSLKKVTRLRHLTIGRSLNPMQIIGTHCTL